jgi:hypothetical protein
MTLVAVPVKAGALAASVPALWVWDDPAAEVTALFVTLWASTAPDDAVGTPTGHDIVGWVTECVRTAEGLPVVTPLFVTEWTETPPDALVGTPAGQARVGCVTEWVRVALGLPEVTALLVGVWVSVAPGPAVVPVATPPVGLLVAIAIARALPPVAVEPMTLVSVVDPVVPPCMLCGWVWFGTSVYVWVWLA